MPTYDYICSNCGKTTEVVHSINGSGPSACPACRAQGTLSKAFNPPTIHFKGSGWAKKDRRPGRPKPAKSAESSPASGTGQEGARSSDSGGGSDDGSGSAAEAKSGPAPEKAATPAASPTSAAD